MKNVNYLVGSPELKTSPMPVFSEEAIAFAAELSKNLMASPASRMYPDISALAFWCRRANLLKMKENCPEAGKRVGRGVCFHIAPGNIPINFAFSYLFGLMAGCANIVRISSKDYPQIRPVCEAVKKTLENYPEIAERTAFVRYPTSDEITAEFCKTADARMIWGGDETIRKIRLMESKPRCVDICFADRYSVCVIDGNAVMEADEKELNRLADNFYNDTYLMDQNACSSQQIMFWLNDGEEARTRFWTKIYEVSEKKYDLQAASAVDKYTHMFEDILDGKPVDTVTREGNLLYRVGLSSLEGDLTTLRGKCGYFYEYGIDHLDEIAPYITEKFQTVTEFGVDPDAVREMVIENHLCGIDRIVPVGKAMDIGIMWDGHDLVRELSRFISLD